MFINDYFSIAKMSSINGKASSCYRWEVKKTLSFYPILQVHIIPRMQAYCDSYIRTYASIHPSLSLKEKKPQKETQAKKNIFKPAKTVARAK